MCVVCNVNVCVVCMQCECVLCACGVLCTCGVCILVDVVPCRCSFILGYRVSWLVWSERWGLENRHF